MGATRVWTPDIKVVNVVADNDYLLHVTFSNGVRTCYDVKPLLDKGVFQRLRDITFFRTAHPAFGTVVWDEKLDLAPEMLYNPADSA
jgi:hypothetical protein